MERRMNHDNIIDQYYSGRTIAELARKYEVNQAIIRAIVREAAEDLKAYQKELHKIKMALPRHKDEKADHIWEAALGQGNFN